MKPQIWSQLKNLTAEEIIQALVKDNWEPHQGRGSRKIFLKDGKLVSIHFHSHSTYGPKQLK